MHLRILCIYLQCISLHESSKFESPLNSNVSSQQRIFSDPQIDAAWVSDPPACPVPMAEPMSKLQIISIPLNWFLHQWGRFYFVPSLNEQLETLWTSSQHRTSSEPETGPVSVVDPPFCPAIDWTWLSSRPYPQLTQWVENVFLHENDPQNSKPYEM